MQQMGVPANAQVALGVAQRPVLQNPGGASIGGASQKRGRDVFRRQVKGHNRSHGKAKAHSQAQAQSKAQGQTGITGTTRTAGNTGTKQASTPTNNNNPVATQLLLNPTFTPVGNVVIDPLNMRIAVPVTQVDGEFILTMQVAGAAPQAQPAAKSGTYSYVMSPRPFTNII
jgi:hypothetical protein